MHRQLAIATVLGALVFAGSASADITMVDASSIQGANVLFNDGVQTGALVLGQTQAGTNVWFTGTTVGGGNIIRANGGQARVEGALDLSTGNPNDTLLLSTLNFNLDLGRTFNNLEFNVFGGTATSASFAITDNEGTVFNFSNVALGNGSSFFGFTGINGQSISNVAVTFNAGGMGALDMRQIRLDEVTPGGPIPEPATWAMMIMGFGAIGAAMRHRRYAFAKV